MEQKELVCVSGGTNLRIFITIWEKSLSENGLIELIIGKDIPVIIADGQRQRNNKTTGQATGT